MKAVPPSRPGDPLVTARASDQVFEMMNFFFPVRELRQNVLLAWLLAPPGRRVGPPEGAIEQGFAGDGF
jgi:hypothetical protein